MQDFASEFSTSARSVLSFLEADHGFLVESTSVPGESHSAYASYAITYSKQLGESQYLRVRLTSTPARGELRLECSDGDFAEAERTIDVKELLAIATPDAKAELKLRVSDAMGRVGIMQEQFILLANALQLHGHRFFDRDQSLWGDVRQHRESQRQQYKREQKERERKRSVHESEVACKAEDWQRVVALLENLAGNLTKAQSARFSYARKQIQMQNRKL